MGEGDKDDRMRHHPTRVLILALLAKEDGDGALTAGEIRARLPGRRLGVERVRYHLRELRRADLIECDDGSGEQRHRLPEREDE